MAKPMVYTVSSAEFDEHRLRRYTLRRQWDPIPGVSAFSPASVLWIMLNPSTADERVLDPTLRRCQQFSIDWGFQGFEVVNLFAWRATDPKVLPMIHDPIGQDNDRMIRDAAERNGLVIAGWGKPGRMMKRDAAVLDLLQGVSISTLGLNGDGTPKHPLYLRKSLKPTRWLR